MPRAARRIGCALRVLTFSLALAGAFPSACGGGDGWTRELVLDVLVESDPGDALPGVVVSIDGEEVGVTSPSGHVQSARTVQPGQLLAIGHSCPSGYLVGRPSRALRVRRYMYGDRNARVSVRLRCQPQTRLAVFVVRVRGAGIVDVLIEGEHAASTDSSGIAHLSRRAVPGTEFLVELTPRNPNLRPKRTSRLFAMADSDEIFVFDQPFRSARVVRRADNTRPRIVRIE